MANSKKESREAKVRLARMQANEAMHQKRLAERKRDNIIAVVAMASAIVLAGVLALTVFTGTKNDAAASDAPPATTAATPEATASSAAPETNSPTVPKIDPATSKTLTGTLSLNGKDLGIEVDGAKAPQAAAVFKSLADSEFLKGKTCHRLADSTDFGMLQCGSLNGDGQGDPRFLWGPVENTPADGKYPAGTIAVARAASTYSNGTQFFITFKDTILPQTEGGYTILGKVTSGLDVVTDIAAGGIAPGAAGASDGAPKTKVTIDLFTLK